MSTCTDGERKRIAHDIETLRGVIHALETALRFNDNAPIGLDGAHALADTAMRLATTVARLDAYQRAALARKESDDAR